MRIIENTIDNLDFNLDLQQFFPLDTSLLIDIETTGLSALHHDIYMIGLGYYKNAQWHIIQFLAENLEEERDLLVSFIQFAENYSTLIHFNGNRFDIPFLQEKLNKYGIEYQLSKKNGIDLFKRISCFKQVIQAPNLKQKTVEQLLGINRLDTFSGKELISVYHSFVKEEEDNLSDTLLLHNHDDILGLIQILPILSLSQLCGEGIIIKKVQMCKTKDVNGEDKLELLLFLEANYAFPFSFSCHSEGIFCSVSAKQITLKAPVHFKELKYFHRNYKEYYYVPELDSAFHKSIASFADHKQREKATAHNCYTKKTSYFLQQFIPLIDPIFSEAYKANAMYFEITDEIKNNRSFFLRYAIHLLQHLIHFKE